MGFSNRAQSFTGSNYLDVDSPLHKQKGKTGSGTLLTHEPVLYYSLETPGRNGKQLQEMLSLLLYL